MQPTSSLQASSVHGLPSSQSSSTPAHTPAEHVSELVHALPSLQGSVVNRGTPCCQVAVVTCAWIAIIAVDHRIGNAGTALTTIAFRASIASSQDASLGMFAQPCSTSQASSVHGFPSSHTIVAPGRHLLAEVAKGAVVPVITRTGIIGKGHPVSGRSYRPYKGCHHCIRVVFRRNHLLGNSQQWYMHHRRHIRDIQWGMHAALVAGSLSSVQALPSSQVDSSTLPSQLSSIPLQISAAASAALLAQSLIRQVRMPSQFDSLLDAQGVDNPRVTEVSEHSQSAPPDGTHCLLSPPSTDVPSAHSKFSGQSNSFRTRLRKTHRHRHRRHTRLQLRRWYNRHCRRRARELAKVRDECRQHHAHVHLYRPIIRQSASQKSEQTLSPMWGTQTPDRQSPLSSHLP